jgi:hypothetical protein
MSNKRDLYPFCAELRLPDGHVANHLDVELDCTIEDDDGNADPFLSVERIYIDGRRIPMLENYSPSLWGYIADQIKKQAEADASLFETVAKDQGVSLPVSDRVEHGTYRTSTNMRAA